MRHAGERRCRPLRIGSTPIPAALAIAQAVSTFATLCNARELEVGPLADHLALPVPIEDERVAVEVRAFDAPLQAETDDLTVRPQPQTNRHRRR